MAMRVALLKNKVAADGASTSLYPRISRGPYTFQSGGSYTGTVAIQVSVDDPSVADASATWYTVGNISANDQLSYHEAIYRIRANPANVTGTTGASVYMLEEISDRIDK